MRRCLLVLMLLSTGALCQQSLPAPVTAKSQLDAQIEQAAQTPTSKEINCFLAVAYPSSLSEYASTRKSAVLFLTVLAKNPAKVTDVRYLREGQRETLSRISASPGVDKTNGKVSENLGKIRSDYLFLIPIPLAIKGGHIEVSFADHEGPVLLDIVAPKLLFDPDEYAIPVDNGTYWTAVKELARREFPGVFLGTRVRVSQRVIEGSLIKRPMPLYPVEAKMGRITGSVVHRVIIGRDGLVKELQLISGHPLLAPAAYEAIRRWQYRPYLLNGEPVEVETQIVVNFTIGG